MRLSGDLDVRRMGPGFRPRLRGLRRAASTDMLVDDGLLMNRDRVKVTAAPCPPCGVQEPIGMA